MAGLHIPSYVDPRGAIITGFPGIGNAIIAEGSGAPTNSVAGYATGCLYFRRDGAADTAIYVNAGTNASSSWVAIVSSALSGLTASAAEINRNNTASARVVTTTVALAVTQALHDGKTIVLNNVVGFATTLPAMTGSGSRYRFVVGATVTTPSHTIVATAANLVGSIFMVSDTTATTMFTTLGVSANATPITTITLNGTTTGGRVGDWIEIEDIATGIGVVRGMVSGSGTEATPFS